MRTTTIAIALGSLLALTTVPVASAERVERLEGSDRFATAAAVSKESFRGTAEFAFVATGANYPDALAAGPVAAGVGPVLLVTRDSVPAPTAGELQRLRPDVVVVLGGPAVISPEVERELGGYASDGVARIAGGDRYETAADLSEAIFDPGVPTVFLATGENFPDALSASAPASGFFRPILLTGRDELPAVTRDELARLDPERVVAIGGEAVISQAVLDAVGAYASEVERLAGEDRFGTNAEVSRRFVPYVETVLIATGLAFPDALAGGPYAGILGEPLLLVTRDDIPFAVGCELHRLDPEEVLILGGEGAVSAAVQDRLAAGHYVADPGRCPPDPPQWPVFVPLGEDALLGDAVIDGQRAFVANVAADTVEVIDLEVKERVASWPAGAEPSDIDVGSDGLLYVANRGANTITAIDPATGEVDRTIVLDIEDERAARIATTADGRAIVTTTSYSGVARIVLVDLASGAQTQLGSTTLSNPAEASGDRRVVWVGRSDSSQGVLYRYRTSDDQFDRHDIDTGSGLLAVDGDGDVVLVNGMHVYDERFTRRGTIPFTDADGGTLGTSAVSADGRTAYRMNGNRLERLDLTSFTAELQFQFPEEEGNRAYHGLHEVTLSRDETTALVGYADGVWVVPVG